MGLVGSSEDAVRVRGVLGEFSATRGPASSTVMTVMNNLHRRRWLGRALRGRAYRYRAFRSRLQAATDALRDLWLADSVDPTAPLLYFPSEATDAGSRALTWGSQGRRVTR